VVDEKEGSSPIIDNISSRVLTRRFTLVNGVTEWTYTKCGGDKRKTSGRVAIGRSRLKRGAAMRLGNYCGAFLLCGSVGIFRHGRTRKSQQKSNVPTGGQRGCSLPSRPGQPQLPPPPFPLATARKFLHSSISHIQTAPILNNQNR